MTSELTAELWAQIRSALETALALPPGDRPAFLESLKDHDPTLRREVEELLAADQDATQLFSIDTWQASADELAVSAEPGMLVGRYRLLRELGRGGMGEVYLAERADGEFQHRVAVKLLHAGVLTRGLAERFRQERQILARLAHPGIARLLDGGLTESGFLYAVMEYVDGEPIDTYCEQSGLSIADRLKLFVKAAEAVQYAHQQLILHLDIKPANLLVTAAGEPRLLDFGISRIIAENESGAAHNEMTMRLLTPRYASPEQAAGEPLGVASDVFSLGTLLYRVLTGRLPYPIEDAAPLEAARMIRERSPEPPSRVAPPERRSELRGDLDLILLQALRKEPERRYATVAAFLDDIKCYLASKPVGAHKDSFRYRAAKFLRRNRGLVGAAAAVALVIAASIALVVHSAVVARRQEALAQRRLRDVRELAHSYIFDLDPRLQGIPGTVAVRSFILKTGMTYLDSMAKEAGSDDALDDELALGYLKLSELENSLLYQSLGNKADSRAALDKAVALETAAYQRNPHDLARIEQYIMVSVKAAMATAELQGDIAGYDAILQKLWKIGQPLLAAKGRPRGLFDMGSIAGEMATNRIGNGALWNLADPVSGLEWTRRSIALMDQVRREYPNDPLSKRAMVDAIYGLATEIDGNIETANFAGTSAALAEFRQRARRPEFKDDPTLAFPRRLVGDYTLSTLTVQHRLAEVQAMASEFQIRDMPEKGNNSRLTIAIATRLAARGSFELEMGNGRQGTRDLEAAVRSYEDLLRADRSDINSAVQIVLYDTRIGEEPLVPAQMRRQALLRVIELSREYAQAHPEVPSAQIRLATAWTVLESIDRDSGDWRGAASDGRQARQAIAILQAALPSQPQAALISSQLHAVSSGKLDHQDACRQRIGALKFWMFLNGQQQPAACSATNADAQVRAVREPARVFRMPSPAAP